MTTKFIKSVFGELTGEYPSASPLARWKAAVEMGALAIAASPLSAETGPNGRTLTEYAFFAATALSHKTAQDYSDALFDAIQEAHIDDVRALIIGGPNG